MKYFIARRVGDVKGYVYYFYHFLPYIVLWWFKIFFNGLINFEKKGLFEIKGNTGGVAECNPH